MNLIYDELGGHIIIASKVIAIKKGPWNNNEQDWYSIFICEGNTEILTKLWYSKIFPEINCKDEP